MNTSSRSNGGIIYLSIVTTIILIINLFFLFKYIQLQQELDKLTNVEMPSMYADSVKAIEMPSGTPVIDYDSIAKADSAAVAMPAAVEAPQAEEGTATTESDY